MEIKKKVDPSKLGSLLEEGTIVGGGFFKGGRVVIEEAFYHVHQYGDYEATLAVFIMGTPMNLEQEYKVGEPLLTLTAGDLRFFRPSNDGVVPLDVDTEKGWGDIEDEVRVAQQGSTYCPLNSQGKECGDLAEVVRGGLSKNTNFVQFISASQKHEPFKERVGEFTRTSGLGCTTTSLELFTGLDVDFYQIPKPMKAGAKPGDELDKRGERKMVTIIGKIYGVKDIASRTSSGAADADAVRKSTSEELEALIKVDLSGNSGTIEKSAAYPLAAKCEDTGVAFDLLNDDDWISHKDRNFKFDKEAGTLSAAG